MVAHELEMLYCSVGSQDQGLGTRSGYLANTISWNACKLLLLPLVLQITNETQGANGYMVKSITIAA